MPPHNVDKNPSFIGNAPMVIVDSKLVSSTLLNKLNQNKEIRLSEKGDILRKTEKQVGGRVGKLLGFSVRPVYENLSKGGKTTSPDSTRFIGSTKSRDAIVTFLRKQVQSHTPTFPISYDNHAQDSKYHYDNLLKDLNREKLQGKHVPEQFHQELTKANNAQKDIDTLEKLGKEDPYTSFKDTDIQRTIKSIGEKIDLNHTDGSHSTRKKWYAPFVNFIRSFRHTATS